VAREPIEGYVRPGETPPAGTHLLLRGSPLTVVKFAEHAARTARAYTYRGEACVGISVELSTSAGETALLLQGRRLSTRRNVARIPVDDAWAIGCVLLPTFASPHYTVVLDLTPSATVEALAALAAQDVIENPYYQTRKED
jgi:hypothetical protein